MALYGGIEAGGTKFVCAVGDEHGHIQEECVVKTTVPQETLPQVIDFFKQFPALQALGIGSFGPIETNQQHDKYGYILHTPKKAWIDCDFLGEMQRGLDLPVGFDTDVSAAALGEYYFGAAQNTYNFVYMTVGTGIGAAAMINGVTVRGLEHAEMGHMRIPHDKSQDPFLGCCLYHGDCFEGLACGTAIKARWQVRSALDLPPNHEAWQLQADYLAAGLLNIALVLSPQKLIVGGGVMRQEHLFPMVRDKFKAKNNDYITLPESLADYIIAPGLGDRAGVIGSLMLAKQASE